MSTSSSSDDPPPITLEEARRLLEEDAKQVIKKIVENHHEFWVRYINERLYVEKNDDTSQMTLMSEIYSLIKKYKNKNYERYTELWEYLVEVNLYIYRELKETGRMQ